MATSRLEYLFALHVQGTIGANERQELLALIDDPAHDDQLQALIARYAEAAGSVEPVELPAESSREILATILRTERAASVASPGRDAKVIGLPRPGQHRWWVAAAIVFLLGTGWWWFGRDRPPASTSAAAARDVLPPASAHATITLANGRVVILDSAANGRLATQAGTELVKQGDGQLVYKAGKEAELVYNTLTVPRGSRIVDLTLADGTRIWLNSESVLRYPAAFGAGRREVEISGEGYFEVAKDRARPFRVKPLSSATSIEVLGTAFNVNTYPETGGERVTLITGSVRVRKGTGAVLLRPGQQAEAGAALRLVEEVDTAAVLAWKNGYFHFDHARLQAVMAELARWYDLDVSYAAAVPDREFGGELQRDLPLSAVLRLLQRGQIHYQLDGRHVTILP